MSSGHGQRDVERRFRLGRALLEPQLDGGQRGGLLLAAGQRARRHQPLQLDSTKRNRRINTTATPRHGRPFHRVSSPFHPRARRGACFERRRHNLGTRCANTRINYAPRRKLHHLPERGRESSTRRHKTRAAFSRALMTSPAA